MNRIFLHLDMDAFFAQVEQRDNPELKGKPVIIGPIPSKGELRGVVSTCSYEARRYGVHSAMPVKQAYKLCPHGVYMHGNFKAYSKASKKLFEIMERYSPIIQPISVDEAFLDITGSLRLFGSKENIVSKLKQDVWDELELTCSVGVAPRKYLSKIASEYRKPDGYTIIEEETMLQFLAGLDISKLWGVGKKSLVNLNRMGIETVGDLQKYSYEFLDEKMGKSGRHLYRLAHGIDNRIVSDGREVKSVSNEHTFREDITDIQILEQWLYKLSEKVSARARKASFYGRTVNLKFRDTNFKTYSRSKTLLHQCKNHIELYEVVLHMLDEFLPLKNPVRLIGVGISHFDEHIKQMDAFEFMDQKTKKIDEIKDKLNDRFGKKTLFGAQGMESN